MKEETNIPQIRAEVLLNRLYPEMEQQWKTRCSGTFYRNYNQDILDLDDESCEVELSRDGFLNQLPQGLYTQQDDLRGEDMRTKFKELERRVKLLKETFIPFDTYWFRQQLLAERKISELLDEKLEYVLRTYFDFDLNKEQNPLVKEAAVILPFVSSKRGDYGFVRLLLEALLHCKVTMELGRFGHTDSSKRWLPIVRYEVLMSELTAKEFINKNTALDPLRAFVCEWLIPMEVECQILIKEHGMTQRTNERLTLDYNTEF